MPAEEKLYRFILMTLQRMLGREGLDWEMRLLMRETIEPTSTARAMVDDFVRPQREILLGILRFRRKGLLPERLDTTGAGKLLAGLRRVEPAPQEAAAQKATVKPHA